MKRLPSAWLSRDICKFIKEDSDQLLGELIRNSSFSIELTQRDAWRRQITLFKSLTAGLKGRILFELTIPRIGSRIDVVLVISDKLFVIECKIGSSASSSSARTQVWDYALDLKNFHEASHDIEIVPIEFPSALNLKNSPLSEKDDDLTWQPITVSESTFRPVIDSILQTSKTNDKSIAETWENAPYKPTPTIVEAARNLYAEHSVHEILRNDAGARNISVTTKTVEDIIASSKATNKKSICFVTGVPGAGKTLVGLNIATRHKRQRDKIHAVYLSGNGPLVKVLVEALSRDEYEREKAAEKNPKITEIRRKVGAFIQNVHHFRDEGLRSQDKPPTDHVVIFDEAQRAWDRPKTSDFMLRRKNIENFNQSEPEFLISYMNRHNDWATIVCLVGGGQEIHVGEAGINGWIEALIGKFPEWRIYISDQLYDKEYSCSANIQNLAHNELAITDKALHLATSMRSFKAENVSTFIKALLDRETNTARRELREFSNRYPIVVTRDINTAKKWIHNKARGSARVGLVASSKAQRLKPHAVDVRVEVNPVHYFLNPSDDVRSSFYLEDAATEFQVQGLELDWSLVCWDGDLSISGDDWAYRQFRGNKWIQVRKPEYQTYLLNAYRVLLTRARQGMVIFIPHGNSTDHTRPKATYDATFEHLISCGIKEIS